MSNNGFEQLATACSISNMLKEIQQEMRELREDIDWLKSSEPPQSDEVIALEGIAMGLWSGPRDPAEKIPGLSWAEEMVTLGPILEEEPSDAARIVEVAPHTKACIKASFHSMSNASQRSLQSKFILPKVSTTFILWLDKVCTELCSKNTKQADRPLTHLQTQMLAQTPLDRYQKP